MHKLSKSGTSGVILLLVIILTMFIGLAGKIYSIPRKHQSIDNNTITLNVALEDGLKYSGTMDVLWRDLELLKQNKVLELTITDSRLVNTDVGVFDINLNISNKVIVNILIDTEKIISYGDRIEPVLGHQLKHVHEALFKYDKKDPRESVRKFIARDDNNKDIIKSNAEMEVFTIQAENDIRKELAGIKQYSSIPKTREEAKLNYKVVQKQVIPTLEDKIKKLLIK